MRTYLVAAGIVGPAVFFSIFTTFILVPKVERLWSDAGLEGSRIQWLMDLSAALVDYFNIILLAVVGILVLLELRYRNWPKRRAAVVVTAAVLVNAVVLFNLTSICTAALMAAPRLALRDGGRVTPSPESSATGEGVDPDATLREPARK